MLQMPVAYGLTLEGGVVYTVESARKEAFDGVKYKIPVSSFKEHLRDRNFEENKAAIALGSKNLGDRYISFFSDGTYSIVYVKDRYRVYTYNKNGKLVELSVRSKLGFPMKAYKYNAKGYFDGVELYVTKQECFIFTANGELVSHWIGNDCYDINGKLILEQIK